MPEDPRQIKHNMARALSDQKTISQLSSSGAAAQEKRDELKRVKEAVAEKEKSKQQGPSQKK
jgi:hypothetical protein